VASNRTNDRGYFVSAAAARESVILTRRQDTRIGE
jgi:hypothetical protein